MMEDQKLTMLRSELHECVSDPLLDTMSFLNEIMDRFPNALSFAPGAPFAGFYDEFALQRYIDRYTAWLGKEGGVSPSGVTKHLYQYGPSRGQINGLLAEALRIDEGIAVHRDSIVVTVGCQEGCLLVLRALFGERDDVLAVANPCFVGIVGAARVLDIPTVPVDETENGLDLTQLDNICVATKARGKRVRAVYVSPDYSNPAGSRLSLSARRELLKIADREDLIIIEDNAYGFTGSDSERLPTLKALDQAGRVVYLGTCAKICLPGLRVGFVVADQVVQSKDAQPRLLSDHLALIKSMVSVNTSPICQAIVGGMLIEHGGSLKSIGLKKAEFYRENLAALLSALDSEIGGDAELRPHVKWNKPEGGFFVRMTLPVECDNALLEIAAREYGVLWTPMRYFSLNRSGDCELRLSCSYLNAEQIYEGVRRLGSFLRDRRIGIAGRELTSSGMA